MDWIEEIDDDLCRFAASCGNLDALQWCRFTQKFQWDQNTFIFAKNNEIRQWVLDRGLKLNNQVGRIAQQEGQEEAYQFLEKHGLLSGNAKKPGQL